jgi:hypothetical protein
MTRFLCLRDPLFLACLLAYFVNRWALKPLTGGGFQHEHLNDLICIPFWVPIMLWGQRWLGFRGSDGPPLVGEILIPLFVWSWFFEFVLPEGGLVGQHAVADHRDIVYYSLGAALAACFWMWWYRGSMTCLADEADDLSLARDVDGGWPIRGGEASLNTGPGPDEKLSQLISAGEGRHDRNQHTSAAGAGATTGFRVWPDRSPLGCDFLAYGSRYEG